jgi:Smg protein
LAQPLGGGSTRTTLYIVGGFVRHSAGGLGQKVTFRILGPHERGRFSPDAWGHLIAMNGAGLLDQAELEHVIDRALAQIEGRIALDDLRVLMEGVGFMDDGLHGDNVTVH